MGLAKKKDRQTATRGWGGIKTEKNRKGLGTSNKGEPRKRGDSWNGGLRGPNTVEKKNLWGKH